MLSQQKAAQTRFARDQEQAKSSVVPQNTGTVAALPSRRRDISSLPPVGNIQPQQQQQSLPQQPIMQQPQQPVLPVQQPQPDPASLIKNEIDIEEFIQSPLVQQSVMRSKLQMFFKRNGAAAKSWYANGN